MDIEEFKSESLKRLFPLIRGIEVTQESIEKVSNLMMKISREEKLTNECIDLWVQTENLTSSDQRRLALLYLANDLIQKSASGTDERAFLIGFSKILLKVMPSLIRKIAVKEERVKC